MAARFVLKKGSTAKYHFNLVATNGQVITSSERYESKASAHSGIESVKRNAPNAEIDDQTRTEPPQLVRPSGYRGVVRAWSAWWVKAMVTWWALARAPRPGAASAATSGVGSSLATSSASSTKSL